MLKILLKKQLAEIFRSYIYDAKKNKARSALSVVIYIALFVVLMVGVLGTVFTLLSVLLCLPLTAAGLGWLYFAIMGLLAVLLGAFGSVFNTYSGLFLAKDNDLLLSMPIPVSTVMAARLLGVYLMGLMYSAIVFIPAAAVYVITTDSSPLSVLSLIIMMLLISVFVLTLSCALGWVVAKVSQKLKNKSFITVIVSLVFIGAYYFFYANAQSVIEELVANVGYYGGMIKSAAYPLYVFGMAGCADPMSLLIISAVILGLFALVWAVMRKSFLGIATDAGKTEFKKYTGNKAGKKGVRSALLARDFGRFFSSPTYMLNCGLGIILLPALGIFGIIKLREVADILASSSAGINSAVIPAVICAAVCGVCSMNDMCAPSFSLEGKSLWIIRTMPVRSIDVIMSKVYMQLILTAVPACVCIICMAFVYPYSAPELVCTVLCVGAYILLNTLFAAFIGLKTANLNWTSEITPIKQGAGVMLSLLVGFALAALCAVGYFLLGFIGFAAYELIFTLVMCALSCALYLWLRRRGVEVFENM